MKNEYDLLLADFKEILFSHGDFVPCEYCAHYIPCNKDCSCYVEGKGGNFINEDGTLGKEIPDMEWSCIDWDLGTCDKLINTPCHGCWERDFSNWEYFRKEK